MLPFMLACGAPPGPPPEPAPPPEVAPMTLPPPFPAATIRDAMPVGTTLRFMMQGETERSWMRWQVEGHEPERVTIRFTPITVDGDPLGDGTPRTSTWDELEHHAHFPEGATRERTTSDHGPAWTYTVPMEDGSVGTFVFADAFPGPPVLHETRRNGEVVDRMVLLERH
ncbi:MAG: hypothetical protein H6736_21430 [Alphaproteobacteria bacterium]|nr:hypothetical protein [Alphaproteobacteria bacterium]